MEPGLCEYLSWDSDLFQLRIGRLKPARLTRETLCAAEHWCHRERIDCLYFLAELDDFPTLTVAEEHDFRLVDVRATLEARLRDRTEAPAPGAPSLVRRFREEDIPALRELARVSHRDSRFYFDPRFPDELCGRLYETWIDKSCRGWADAVFVADLGTGPVGYATARRVSDTAGDLGLMAVDAQAQGRGLGRQLAAAVLDWGRRERLDTVHVVTQGRNCPAMRMYAHSGFLPRTLQLWYHRWFSLPDPGVQHGRL
jgi:dTDP-4-amino-4,6-dideoxy-D-galactose acyltransferase